MHYFSSFLSNFIYLPLLILHEQVWLTNPPNLPKYLSTSSYEGNIQILGQNIGETNYPKQQRSRADRLYEIGRTHELQDEYSLALEFYEEALQIYRVIVDRRGEARSLYSIGSTYERQANYQQAVDNYQQALLVFRDIDSEEGEWRTLSNLGAIYVEFGRYSEALNYHQQALVIIDGLDDPQYKQAALNNLGGVYRHLGQYEQALKFYQQALELNRTEIASSAEERTYQQRSEGIILHNIGFTYQLLQQHSQAIEFYQQALLIYREIGFREGEAEILSDQGFSYLYTETWDLALSALQRSFTLSQEINNYDGTVYALNGLGKVYISLNRFDRAWNAYQQALITASRIGDRPQQRLILSNIADLFVQQNQPELAIIFYKQSVNITEAIRRDIEGLPVEYQQSYTNTIADTYRKLADLLLQQDRVLEAQQVLDLLKVQEIQDYLRRGVRGSEQTAEGIYLLDAEQQVFAQFDELLQQGRRLAELEAIPLEDLTPEQQADLSELSATRTQIKATFNGFLDLPDVQAALQNLRVSAPQALDPNSLDAIRQSLAHSRQDAVLLYPFVLDDRLELVVLSPHLPPIHQSVAVTRVELNQAIADFLLVLQNPEADAKPAAAKLYDWLVRPIEPFLAESGANVILYAPDRQLRYIPLAALYDGEQWFVEKFQINQLTAVGLTSLNIPPHAQPRILAGAFSEGRHNISRRNGEFRFPFNGLPFTKVEVETIASLFPGTRQLINQDFTEAATLPFLNNYNIIHFATHAMFNTGAPEDSFIVMGNGDTIDLNEIRNLSLTNVDLMVLSACQTAVSTLNLGGDLGDGVEILGFGYQVQNAGVRAAIASLWSVDDGGTEVLMSQFYALLQQGGLSKAEALQQAQIALIRGEEPFQLEEALIRQRNFGEISQLDAQRLMHPHYWAPFILIGNGL